MNRKRTYLTEVVICQKDLYERSLLFAINIEMVRTHEDWKGIVFDADDIHIMPVALHDKLLVSVEFDAEDFPLPDDS